MYWDFPEENSDEQFWEYETYQDLASFLENTLQFFNSDYSIPEEYYEQIWAVPEEEDEKIANLMYYLKDQFESEDPDYWQETLDNFNEWCNYDKNNSKEQSEHFKKIITSNLNNQEKEYFENNIELLEKQEDKEDLFRFYKQMLINLKYSKNIEFNYDKELDFKNNVHIK